MASYNLIESKKNKALVEGTADNDSIIVGGNFSTVQAGSGNDVISLNGGKHDNSIWVDGEEENFVYGGEGKDTIAAYSRGASVYGEAGNDIIRIRNNYIYADGGKGNDYFEFGTDKSYSNVTITGGEGKDTITPAVQYDHKKNFVVTDFSNDDVLRIDEDAYSYYYYSKSGHSSRRVITQHVENGNVVISDNSSIKSSGKDTVTKNVTPIFSITLQGVSDISQVADAQYRIYKDGKNLKEYGTFRDLFGIKDSAVVATETATETITTAVNTTTTVTTTTKETTTTTTSTTGNENTNNGSNGGVVVNNYNYYGDTYNVNDNNGTVIIGSNVTGDVNNNTSVDNSKTIVISGNTWTYSGGNKVINNYQQGEVVELASDYAGIDFNESSFFVKSSSGQVEIENARDKFIGYSAGGQMAAYSYMASGAGDIDGRAYDKAEIMIGGDNADNNIYAGNAGSSLWGGNGGNDVMTGGDGYDEFFYTNGSGGDVVKNASSDDVVNLLGVSLEDITDVDVKETGVDLKFTDGGNLHVEGNTGVGYKLQDTTYICDQSTGEWSTK